MVPVCQLGNQGTEVMGAHTGLEINLSLLCFCFPVLRGSCWLKAGFLSSSYSVLSYCPCAGSSMGCDGVEGSQYSSVLGECQQGADRQSRSVAAGGWRKERLRVMEELMVPPHDPPSPVVLYSKGACVVVSMWSEMFPMKLWVVALLQRRSVGPRASMGGGVRSLPGAATGFASTS